MLPLLAASANPSAPRRLLVIANPISGGGRSRALVPKLCSALSAHGIATEAYFTERAGDASRRAKATKGESFDGIIAAGGDGTINEVLNGMSDPTLPLGFLPVGTANVLAVELGLPSSPVRAAEVFARGKLREHAIGECQGRRFLLFVGAGLDGAVVERLSRVRSGTLGKHKWAGPILHVLRRWPSYALRVTFPDGSSVRELSSVLVTRSRNFGGVVRLTPDIDPGDGMLHVLCFKTRGRCGWLWLGVRAFFGRLRPGSNLEVRQTTAVTIEGDAPYQIDGDFGGRSPVEVRLLPTPARLFTP